MLADFLVPYLVTIAGVVTTGVAAVALRSAWRWATAPEPGLVRLRIGFATVHILNEGDFVVWWLRASAPPPEGDDWSAEFRRPRRYPPHSTGTIDMARSDGTQLPTDRSYRVVVADEHHARWELTYAPGGPAMQWREGVGPSELRRIWPEPLAWVIAQWVSPRALLNNWRRNSTE